MRTGAGWLDLFIGNRIFKSIIRVGWPKNQLERSMAIFTSFFLHLQPVKVNVSALRVGYSLGLGLISFYLFAILSLTGILLMFYYVPFTERAYADIQGLSTTVAFGGLLRNIHRWSAHAMVMVVFLHMLRVFYTGAYRTPREFNWSVGVILMVLTLLLSFTGYLLPWDQLAFWAITVGTNIGGAAPFIGDQVRFALLGGPEVGQEGLLRFYVLHVIALPAIATVLIGVHFWRIRKDGFSG